MTDDLFRKEALEHRSRSLYGQVVLRSPRGLWVITILLVLLSIGIIGFLLLSRITIDSGVISLFEWLFRKSPS